MHEWTKWLFVDLVVKKLSNQLKSLRRYTTPPPLKDLIYCRLYQKKSISNHTWGWHKHYGNVIWEHKFQKNCLINKSICKISWTMNFIFNINDSYSYIVFLSWNLFTQNVFQELKKIKPFSIWKLIYKYELIYLQCVWRSCFCLKHFIESGKYIVLLT